MGNYAIASLEEFITQVRKGYAGWGTTTYPWFRGEPENDTPLIPKLYRKKSDGTYHNENQLLQFFRMKAPSLARDMILPPRESTDQWLFLARHVGLPTRLLDWTEGALIALYFALSESLKENSLALVWMLDPCELNRLSVAKDITIEDNEFPLTWYQPKNRTINIGNINIRGAWGKDNVGVNLPVAVHPTNIHPRMSAQKSCFTIHGQLKEGLSNLVGRRILKRYAVDEKQAQQMLKELKMLGISHTTIFPELQGLCRELENSF